MTRIEEKHVVTTTHQDEPVKPHVDNINMNVNTDGGETITVDHPDQTRTTRTETTHTETHESD